MIKLLESITQFIRLPASCVLCMQTHREAQALCRICCSFLSTMPYRCKRCAIELNDDHFPYCGHCIHKAPSFHRAYISYLYQEPLSGLIHLFKYQKKAYLSSFLSKLMYESLAEMDEIPQCLVPVPLHIKKLKTRGFNQSALLAKNLSKLSNIPVHHTLCYKTINTPAQAALKKEERIHNLKGSFEAKPNHYKHVMLVDDILTTGNTLNELAQCLLKTGIERVDVCCIARAS